LHNQLDRVVGWFQTLGRAAIPLVVFALVSYWAWRIVRKRRVIRLLRTRRLPPDQLRARLESGAPIRIVDLRAAIDRAAARQAVPGAIRMDPEELDERHREIPRDCDIVLYCSCPNEATSARVALALRKYGIERVFPLDGGIEAWVSRGYPVERIDPTLPSSPLPARM
jgi:rhodanese-related sulfurtransferase